MRLRSVFVVAAGIILGTSLVAWAATNVTNSTGTSTSGNIMQECNTTGICSSDAGIAATSVAVSNGGTFTVGDVACIAALGPPIQIQDCGVAPLTGFTGTGNAVGSTSPTISNAIFTGAPAQAESQGNPTNGIAEYTYDYNGTQTVNTTFAEIAFQAEDSASTLTTYGSVTMEPTSNTAAAVSGLGRLAATSAGTSSTELRWGGGGGVAIGTLSPKGKVGTLIMQNETYPGYTTVASLPTCNSSEAFAELIVSDSTSTTFNATPTGSGNNAVKVGCLEQGGGGTYAWRIGG
jgi:hypothetical protein